MSFQKQGASIRINTVHSISVGDIVFFAMHLVLCKNKVSLMSEHFIHEHLQI